jgi:hypothetical protein
MQLFGLPRIPAMPTKFKVLLAFVFGALMLDGATFALAAPASPSRDGLTISVEGDDWGAVRRQDIEALLYVVARTFAPATGAQPARTIMVAHTRGAPVVLYDHGQGGEYHVLLHASETNWHLYVYEFAHEFCHIVSNYDEHPRVSPRHNQWFEESLCETASLYALKTLANDWQVSPPAAPLADAGRQLRWFYDLLMAEEHRRIADGDFDAWLQDREAGLRHDPYQRRLNEVVATRLLPIFLKDGGKWDALRYLNLDSADNDCSLDEYLEHWYGHARADQKSFVAAVRTALATDARAPMTVAAGNPQLR